MFRQRCQQVKGVTLAGALVIAVLSLVVVVGCETPAPLPRPPAPPPGCSGEYECEGGASGFGVECHWREKMKWTTEPTATQPASQPGEPDNQSGRRGEAFRVTQFVESDFCTYGWETDDPNTMLVDLDVLEFTYRLSTNPFGGGGLSCGLPLAYGEPPPCDFANKVVGVWARQSGGTWLITCRGTMLQNALLLRDDLGVVALEGLAVPILWDMLTPEEQALAEANGVSMTRSAGMPDCRDLAVGRITYRQPQYQAVE